MRDNELHSLLPANAFETGCPHLVVRFPVQVIPMPPLRLFGWSRMTSADRCGMRQLLSQVAVMECHSVGVRVEGKAAQCRVMERTTVLSRYCVDWMPYMA